MKHNFKKLINTKKLQSLVDDYCRHAGFAGVLTDLEGNVLISSMRKPICTNYFRVHPETYARCYDTEIRLANKMIEESGKGYSIFDCPNGLMDAVAPVRVSGEWVANFYIGQFITSTPDLKKFEKMAEKYGFDKGFMASLKRDIAVIPREEIESHVKFITGFAGMLGEMWQTEQKMQEYQDKLEEIIDQRTKELKDALEKAKSANKAKSIFLANMSHEIRTPMNAILGFTEILQGKVIEPQLKRYINSIHISGKSLLTLINDILDLSKIEAGKLKLQQTPVSLVILFEELEIIFAEILKDKQLKFIKEINFDLPKALILDETRLRQILVNLLGNAVKFTDEGYIKISAQFTRSDKNNTLDELQFNIEDTGIGIADKQKKVIFEAFEQQKGQNEKQYGGTGLGLSITKRLIEMMNGKIKVESEVGKGSLFSFSIKDVEIASSENLKTKTHQSIDSDSIEFDKCVVLVADDIDYNRDIIIQYLENYQLSIIEADNGKEVIKMAKQYHPDLILLDLKMPGMDGYQAKKILKNDKALKDIPIIMVSASFNKQEEEKVLKDFDSFIRKPLSKTDLITEMVKFLPYTIKKDIHPIALELKGSERASGDIDKIKLLLSDITELIYTDLGKTKICLESLTKLLDNYNVHKVLKKLETQMDNFETESVLLSLEEIAHLLDISIGK